MTLTHARVIIGDKSESCFTVLVTFAFAALRTSAEMMAIVITRCNMCFIYFTNFILFILLRTREQSSFSASHKQK